MAVKMKKTFKIFIIAFLVCIFFYVLKIDSIPKNIILYNGENIEFSSFLGVSLKYKDNNLNTILTSTELEENNIKETTAQVKLFDIFTVKEVTVNTINEVSVIPVGQISGLKLYTNGVLVVGMSEIKANDNIKYKPYKDSGIEEGNRIIKINDENVQDTNHLIEKVNASNGESLKIEYIKDNESNICQITPVQATDGKYKLGLWVRDSSAGIGTLTFYEPSTGYFAALGHGITDIDTGELIEISNGDFITAKILSIIKGQKGNPGKIQGSIEDGVNIGKIYKNTNLGVYGTINNITSINTNISNEIKVAKRNEIELGNAYILCNLDGTKSKEYEIEIKKIFINNNQDNKSMLIKIKDKDLIDKTGGIIQGMSGSPIIQNGKFIRSSN